MFEARDPDKPVRDLGSEAQNVPRADFDDCSLAGKRRFGKRPSANEKRIEEAGSSLVAICLRKRLAIRIDDTTLDLSPEFCTVLVDNLAVFSKEIEKFCYDQVHLKEVLRCCMLCSVIEFYDWQYSEELSQVTTFVQSLIVSDSHTEDMIA